MRDMSALHEARKDKTSLPPVINPIDKWEMSNKTSRALAVKAKCAECMGCERGIINKGFRSMIRKCDSTDCPLHVFRPYQEKSR